MKCVRVFFALGIFLGAALPAEAQRTLYVNGATGNDSVSKANNSASTPWRTIGRAAWGSTNRAAPIAAEAAAAGDTVLITGGTYTTSVAVNNRWGVVYNPINNGTATSPITFTCVGSCILGAPNANAPVIGSDDRNHIRWFADVARGSLWSITAYGPQSGTATATQVNTAPDTGPVVCHGGTGCWIEGATIDGGVQTDYTDNWNGVRVENCTSCVVRNNQIRNFRNGTNSVNGTAVTLYGSANAIIENNVVANVATAVIFKDTNTTLPQNGVRVRYNSIDGVDRCFVWSVTAENRNYVYQNVCVNSGFGVFVTGGGLSNDWIFNNTFYNIRNAGVYPTSLGSGGRFWNNIMVGTPVVVMLEAATMPGENVIDLEHNVYFNYTNFYSGPEGERTLSSFRSAYPGHEGAAPASITGNPLFVDAAAYDFRICVAAGSPASNCSGASAAIGRGVDIGDLDGDGDTTELIPAGAYVNNSEMIGIGVRRPASPTALRIIR